MIRAAVLAVPAALLLAAASPPTAPALDEARRARETAAAVARDAAAQAQAQAEAQSGEADRLAAARVEAAAGLRATEDQLSELANQIALLQSRHDAAATAAEAQAARLAPLLPLAERLGLYPVETLLTVPAPPEQAVRGVLVLEAIAREVQAQVAALARRRLQAGEMARSLRDARQSQAEAAARQRAAATELDQQLTEARRRRELAQDAAATAAEQAAAEAARAESLRAAIATIEARRAADAREAARLPLPPPAPPPPSSPASLETPAPPGPGDAMPGTGAGAADWATPVAGRISRNFGAATEAGPASGTTFQTPPGARVVTPCPGRVVFAGPFRSYGQLVIVQCGAGVHAVLAGLGRLDALAGQPLRRGEPVGVMGSAGGALYVEARRGGIAVDPSLYLRQKG